MYDNDGMLISIKRLNDHLLADRFCVPPYNSINGKWVRECFERINAGELDKLKYHVTKEIVLPWRRAYQTTYYYSELKPFKPLVKVIDAATLAYYQDNFFCAYIAILPVVEGVIDRWGTEVPNYNPKGKIVERVECIMDFARTQLKPDLYYHNHLLIQLDYLHNTLKDIFFAYGTGYIQSGNNDAFNRNVMAHLLDVPDFFTSNVHTLRVFLLLDILAVLYAETHVGDYEGLNPVSDATHKPELMDLYFGIYKSCAIKTNTEGSYNISLEQRIYAQP